MPGSIWKGALTFGLVTVPVAMYSATEGREELKFRLLHTKDASPIEYRRICKDEDTTVPWGEIVKGYEYKKGQFVVMSDEDFEHARTPATQAIEILDVVPAGQIDPMYFATPYYLEPRGKGADKSFALLRDALAKAERIGIGTLVLRHREHLVGVQATGAALVCTALRYAHEIRSPRSLDLPRPGAGWAPREMDLALKLVDTLAADWKPEKYKDTYTDLLRAAIKAKVEGKEIALPRARTPRKVVDLVKALEQSLKTPRKELARAAPHKADARRRRRLSALSA